MYTLGNLMLFGGGVIFGVAAFAGPGFGGLLGAISGLVVATGGVIITRLYAWE